MKSSLLRDIYAVVAPQVPPTLPEYLLPSPLYSSASQTRLLGEARLSLAQEKTVEVLYHRIPSSK
jgi:hypothetical protein